MNLRTHTRSRRALQLARSTHPDRGWVKLSDFKASLRGQARAGTPIAFGDGVGFCESVRFVVSDVAKTC